MQLRHVELGLYMDGRLTIREDRALQTRATVRRCGLKSATDRLYSLAVIVLTISA